MGMPLNTIGAGLQKLGKTIPAVSTDWRIRAIERMRGSPNSVGEKMVADVTERVAKMATDAAEKSQAPDAMDAHMRLLGTAERRGLLGRRTQATSFLSGPMGAKALTGQR